MPINQKLYELLKQRLGKVLISNEGSSASVFNYRDPITGRMKANLTVKGEHYRINCPFCNDTRKRLYVNHLFGTWDETTNSNNYHLAHCHNEDCLRVYEGNRDKLVNMVFGHFNRSDRKSFIAAPVYTEDSREYKVELPGEVVPLHKLPFNHFANNYLRLRGYDPFELGEYLDVSYCQQAKDDYRMATNRIIIPIYMDGQLKGWQARFIGDRDWKTERIPKYYTMPGTQINALLYNYDTAKKFDTVVVVEGPSDVWSVGPQAVALFNFFMKDKQKRLIAETWRHKNIVMMLDPEPDAQAESNSICEELRRLTDGNVVNVKLPSDPGSCDKDYIWDAIESVMS